MRVGTLTVMLVAASVAAVRAERYEGVFEATDRVAVVEHDYADGSDDGSATPVVHVLYDSSAATDVESLRSALRAAPRDGICGCMASIEIHLYRGNERLATVYYLGSTLKGDLWGGDAEIVDHEALLRWFDARGIAGPREDEHERLKREEEQRRAEGRWLAAMPESLVPLWIAEWKRIRQEPVVRARPAWKEALERDLPDPVERAGALLTWFGSGRWGSDGAAGYEEIAENMVRDAGPEHLAIAIQEYAGSASVLEGAARLVCGVRFTEHDVELDLLEPLEALLRDHVRKSADAEKRACAEQELAPR